MYRKTAMVVLMAIVIFMLYPWRWKAVCLKCRLPKHGYV
jgi:hypothetical protein